MTERRHTTIAHCLLHCVVIAVVTGCIVALLCCHAHGELLPGTVLVSRNINERENTSPGYWNHLAMYAGNGIILEAQAGQGVIRTTTETYFSRPYSRVLAMEPVSPEAGLAAVRRAESHVGLPFRQLASLRGRDTAFSISRGMNCDTLVRDAYRTSTGRRDLRRLRIPDNVFNFD